MKYTKSSNLLVLAFLGFAQAAMGGEECKPELWGKIGDTSILIAKGDITKLKNVDAIVNPASKSLQHSLGVQGAISEACHEGKTLPERQGRSAVIPLLTTLQIHCNGMPNYEGCNEKCPPGSAVITPSFGLKKNGIKNIIHAVGPHSYDKEKYSTLYYTYFESCAVAHDNGLRSVAFPAISADDVSRYDIKDATPCALSAVKHFIESEKTAFDKIIFVLLNDDDYNVYKENAKNLFAADDANPEVETLKEAETLKTEETSSFFSFRNIFYAAIPVSLLGIIWYFWRKTAQ